MGLVTHSIEHLGPPFLSADEMIFYVPKGGQLHITKELSKIIFVLDGEIEHEFQAVAGRQRFRAGDILVSLGGKHHCLYNSDTRRDTQLHVFRVFLDNAVIQKSISRRRPNPTTDLADFLLEGFPGPCQLSGAIDGPITECLNTLRRESEQKAYGYQLRCHALCLDLCILVARKQRQSVPKEVPLGQSGTHVSPIVASAKEYILKNLDAKLTLADIAWRTGKGEEHLARVFKRETGQSVFDYVREMRIHRAKTYLFDTSLTLTKIAELCGFSSLSYFSQTFHELTGGTPSNYRRQLSSEVLPGPVNQSVRVAKSL